MVNNVHIGATVVGRWKYRYKTICVRTVVWAIDCYFWSHVAPHRLTGGNTMMVVEVHRCVVVWLRAVCWIRCVRIMLCVLMILVKEFTQESLERIKPSP